MSFSYFRSNFFCSSCEETYLMKFLTKSRSVSYFFCQILLKFCYSLRSKVKITEIEFLLHIIRVSSHYIHLFQCLNRNDKNFFYFPPTQSYHSCGIIRPHLKAIKKWSENSHLNISDSIKVRLAFPYTRQVSVIRNSCRSRPQTRTKEMRFASGC